MKKKIVLMLALVLWSCPQKKEVTDTLAVSKLSIRSDTPSYKLQDEYDELVWYINFDWYLEISGDNLVFSKILEDTNSKLRIIRGDDDRLNQMIATGEMPDIVTVGKGSSFEKTASRWATSLNQLADTYDPYFYQVAKPDVLRWYTLDDGNIYGYPAQANSYDDYMVEDSMVMGGEVFLVRGDLYEAIGNPDMRIPEYFLQALRDVKARNPEIIPLVLENQVEGDGSGGIAAETLMNFLAIPTLKDGKYYERVFDDEYIRWIKVLRQAYQEGLISDDNFSFLKEDFNEGFERGNYFAVLVTSLAGVEANISRNYIRDATQPYIAVNGPANSDLAKPTLKMPGLAGWAVTLIPKQAKNRERSMQLLTYMISKEGILTTNLGVEGLSYMMGDDGLYRYTPAYQDMRDNELDRFKKETQIGQFWMVEDKNVRFRLSDIIEEKVLKQIYEWSRGKNTPRLALEDTDLEFRSAEYRRMMSYMDDRRAAIIRMIRASTEEELLAELESLRKKYQDPEVVAAFAMKNDKIAYNFEKMDRLGIKY